MCEENKLASVLEYLDHEVQLLLDASTEDDTHKRIRTEVLSRMSLDLMKLAPDEFTKMFIQVLEKIIPVSDPQFPTLIGSCMLLAAARLYENDEENEVDQFMMCLVSVLKDLQKRGV